MGTMSEEILSGHVGKKVKAGDIVVATVDFMMSQDGTTGLTIKAFNDMNGKKILDPSRYAIVIDHNAPSPLEGVSNIHKQMREFAAKYGGDALWALLVFLGFGFLFRQLSTGRLALIALSERMRPDAAATVAYLRREGVEVKIISGDGPATVAAVAADQE